MTSLVLTVGTSQSVYDEDIKDAIEKLSIVSPTPVEEVSLMFVREKKNWLNLINAIAKVPRRSVFLSFLPKNGTKRVLPKEVLTITTKRMTICNAVVPSPLQFMASSQPTELTLRNCESIEAQIKFTESTANCIRRLSITSAPIYQEKFENLKALQCGDSVGTESLQNVTLSEIEYFECVVEKSESIDRVGIALSKMPKLHTLKIIIRRSLIGKLLEMLKNCVMSPIRTLTLVGKDTRTEDPEDGRGFDWFPILDNLQILQLCKFRLGASPSDLFADLPMLGTLMLRNTKLEKPREIVLVRENDASREAVSTALNEDEITAKITARRKQMARSRKASTQPQPIRVRVIRDNY